MKKVFVAACSMALVLGLAGCGSDAPQSSDAEYTSEYAQVEGLTDEESVAKARGYMEALIAAPRVNNQSEVDSVKTTTVVDGQNYSNTVTTTKMIDTTGEVPKFYIKTETEPAAETDAEYYIHGKEGVLQVEDEKAAIEISDEYLNSLLNPENSKSFAVYYDCAEEISYFEGEGARVVQIKVNPEKLMASGVLEGFTNIESCIAEYSFNEEGEISTFINTIVGTAAAADGSSEGTDVTITTKSAFYNTGTTEVPDLPAIDDAEGESAAENAEQTGEAQPAE